MLDVVGRVEVETAGHAARQARLASPQVATQPQGLASYQHVSQRFTELVLTGDDSWAERDLELWVEEGRVAKGDEDSGGPLSIAVAGTLEFDAAPASREDGAAEADDGATVEARIVVFGDSDFASNQLIPGGRNRDLFVNSVNWLMGDVEAISIRPAPTRAPELQLSGGEYNQLRYLSLFVLPEAIALLGVVAWWSRRRAPGR